MGGMIPVSKASKSFEPHVEENQYVVLAEHVKQGLDSFSSSLASIEKYMQRKVRKQWVNCRLDGSTLEINFDVMAIYVDNSQNASSVTFQSMGDLGNFEVGANSQMWIYPLGARIFQVSSAGSNCKALFTDSVVGRF